MLLARFCSHHLESTPLNASKCREQFRVCHVVSMYAESLTQTLLWDLLLKLELPGKIFHLIAGFHSGMKGCITVGGAWSMAWIRQQTYLPLQIMFKAQIGVTGEF